MKYVKIFLISLMFLSYTGCTSYTNQTADPIKQLDISYDEYGNKTAGVLKVVRIDGDSYFIITAFARDKYNGLIAKYGELYVPVLKKDLGVTKYSGDLFKDKAGSLFLMNRLAMYYFQDMMARYRNERIKQSN